MIYCTPEVRTNISDPKGGTTLDNGLLRLAVDAQKGAGVRAFSCLHNGNWLPLMPDTGKPVPDLDCAGFLMIPYSNRIENGRFYFEGKEYQLSGIDNHAMHGVVTERNWRIMEAGTTHLTCLFESWWYSDIDWPWSFEAWITYRLDGFKLSSEITIKNMSDLVMPLGMGWHPYFSRALTRKGEPVLVHMNASSVYPDANDNRIPSGPPEPVPDKLDFSTEKELDENYFIDSCFYGYDGGGSITWPESGVKLNFECSDECRHLVIYNPLRRPYFAVEPVTNANNGFNLYACNQPDSGVIPLEPGRSATAFMNLQVDLYYSGL